MTSHTFDEGKFLPHPRRAADYKARVASGRETAASCTAVIVALARNVEASLPATVARIEHTGALFKDYRVVVYENDSQDSTPAQLREWAAANSRVVAISERLNDPINPGTRCLSRAARMANYRNKCQDVVLSKFSAYSHVLLVETDLPDGWSYDGILNTFGQPILWHMVGSNGIIYRQVGRVRKPLQYDAWAWRRAGSWDPQPPQRINPLFWSRGEPMIALNSCFGGLGIYTMEAFASSRYDGSDCEHVPFHKGMKDAGFTELFMNPSQIVLYSRP